MVCVFQVDSVEGPMPQTRFVLKKALEFGHAVVVVVNKVDRSSARPEFVINSTFELFIELNASDEQVIYRTDKNWLSHKFLWCFLLLNLINS